MHWVIPIISSSLFSVAALLFVSLLSHLTLFCHIETKRSVLNYSAPSRTTSRTHIPPMPRLWWPELTLSVPCSARDFPSSPEPRIATSGSAGPAHFSRSSPALSCPFLACCTSTADGSGWLASARTMTLNRLMMMFCRFGLPRHWTAHLADMASFRHHKCSMSAGVLYRYPFTYRPATPPSLSS